MRAKLEAFIHLTNNLSYALMILLSLLIFPAMVLRKGMGLWQLLAIDVPLFFGATISVIVYYLVSQHVYPGGTRRGAVWLPSLMGLGIGLAVNNTRAVLNGLREDGGVFHRTPKYRIEKKADGWVGKEYRLTANLSFPARAATRHLSRCLRRTRHPLEDVVHPAVSLSLLSRLYLHGVVGVGPSLPSSTTTLTRLVHVVAT